MLRRTVINKISDYHPACKKAIDFNRMNLRANTSARRTALVAGSTLVLSITLAGCAGLGTSQAPEATVRQLATQRWQALLAQDFEKAYAFAAPSFRQLSTPDTYKRNRRGGPVKWLAAKVFRVDCEDKKCAVRIELESQPIVPFMLNSSVTTGLDETWVFEAGQWWMLETL